jgi:hypothetical protein
MSALTVDFFSPALTPDAAWPDRIHRRGFIVNQLVTIGSPALPELAAAGERAGMRFLEFFAANIRNPHTRRAYARAAEEFLAWCAAAGVPSHVDSIERRGRNERGSPVKGGSRVPPSSPRTPLR